MTTSQIEQYANMGDLSSPDINLQVLLRHDVSNAFMADVGYVAWRRIIDTIDLTPGAGAVYPLPPDFWMMQVMSITPGEELRYLGDEPLDFLGGGANNNPDPGLPSGYWLLGATPRQIQFSSVPDQPYTVNYTYYNQIVYPDDVTDVELNLYVPNQFQWALVEGLKAKIMYLRFGVNDPRYTAAENAYGMWIQRATQDPELAHRSKVSYVR